MDLVERIKRAPPNAIAAIDDHGASIRYGELRDKAFSFIDQLGRDRQLVLLEGGKSVDWLIAYVACLAGRHPTLMATAGSELSMSQLSRTFSPDIIVSQRTNFSPVHTGTDRKEIHPDLAVLLSTSGSTGSAKCVRLSLSNLSANAASICEYLEIGADERGCVNLPTHYSYGLSIVNSHLYAGASLLLTDRSVLEEEFWQFVNEHEATSFAGVPHSYELLERIVFEEKAPPSLRYFTQAGGRLPLHRVAKFSEIAKRHGWRFYVMYGQTEATARMAYLPPDQLASHIGSIGIVIPGGTFSLVGTEGQDVPIGEQGQLVYEGPNVMMGYAASIEDLTLPAMPARLETGDLATVNEAGFYTITGRLSRFIKIFGNRIGLDDVEKLLATSGYDAIASGVEEHLLVVTRDPTNKEAIELEIESKLMLPLSHFAVNVVEEYPLLPTGKIDYASLQQSIETEPNQGNYSATHRLLSLLFPRQKAKNKSVFEVFFATFGEAARNDEESFRSLGGDSLAYVGVRLGLEETIAELPEGWETLSIATLIALEESARSIDVGQKTSLFANLDTLRGGACLLVVLYHVIGMDANTGVKLEDGSFWRWLVTSLTFFRMPLFFAMSGFLYASMPVEREGYFPFLRRRFFMLMVPALFASTVYWAIRQVVFKEDENLFALLMQGYLHFWFLYALMLMLVVAATIDSLLKSQWKIWVALMVIMPILGDVLPRINLLCISEVPTRIVYFLLGIVLYRAPMLLTSKNFLAIAIVVAIASLAAQQSQWLYGIPSRQVAYYIAAIGGCACIVCCLFLVPRITLLEVIGAYSFTIYLWHPLANAAMRTLLLKLDLGNTELLIAMGVIAGVIMPVILHRIISRFPWWLSRPIIGR